jgi:hypothetical protein
VPMVVCCRSADYPAQTVRVLLQNAVVVQPLTPEQIEQYLSNAGGQLMSVRAALRNDLVLQELIATPLMLSVLSLAYRGMPLGDLLAAGSLTAQRRHVFATYVQRMLHHRGSKKPYTVQQTVQWLARLAQQMTRHSQAQFYIEHMQFDWLPTDRLRRIYTLFAVKFPAVLIGVLVSLGSYIVLSGFFFGRLPLGMIGYGLLSGLVGEQLSRGSTATASTEKKEGAWRNRWYHVSALRSLGWGILIGLGVGLSFGILGGTIYGLDDPLLGGLIYGISFGLSGALLNEIVEKGNRRTPWLEKKGEPRLRRWSRLITTWQVRGALLVGLIVGLGQWLYFGLLRDGLIGALDYGLNSGVSYGVIWLFQSILLSVILKGMNSTIHPVEVITWSWRSLGRSLLNARHRRNGLLVGGSIGLVSGLFWGVSGAMGAYLGTGPQSGLLWALSFGVTDGLSWGLSWGLSVGLSYWLLLGLFQGVSSETLDEHERVVPNQGIHRSAHNSLFIGAISGGIIWVMYILSFILNAELQGWLTWGLSLWLHTRLVDISGLSDELSMGLNPSLNWDPLTVALAGGLLAGLLSGGLACFRHGILRVLLWRTGSVPGNYSRFLDAAAELLLLRKIGGGYIFIHRLLLDYYASLDTPSISHEHARRTQKRSHLSASGIHSYFGDSLGEEYDIPKADDREL